MWTLSRIICMGMLTGLSLADVCTRRIPSLWLVIGSLLAAGYQIAAGEEDIWLILGGVGVGILFLAVSRFTGESMGYGDSWAILILGIYLGLWELLTALTGAFFLLAAVSAAGLAAKKMSKRLRIPFYPFLTAGYLMSVIW